MDNQQLRERLEHLRSELEQTPAADANAHALRARLMHDVQTVLDGSADMPPHRYHALAARLRAARLQFDIAHPQLTWTMSQVNDTLIRMGL